MGSWDEKYWPMELCPQPVGPWQVMPHRRVQRQLLLCDRSFLAPALWPLQSKGYHLFTQ